MVETLFKGRNNPNRVGDGTTMDAVRSELVTGRATGRGFHVTKARETIRGLQNWLRRNPEASPGDRAVAKDLIDQLKDALRGA